MKKEPLVTKLVAFSLVEVILASAVFGLFVTALWGTYLYGEEATALAGSRARATLLAEEGLEAARNIRDANFTQLADGTFGLSIMGDQWALSGTEDTLDIFTRDISIATIDSKRKEITSRVTWSQNAQRTGTVSLVTRLTNWMAVGIGNWASPRQEAALNVAGNNNLNKIQVQGNYVYATFANGNPDFLVIDVSQPESPSLVGSLALPGTPTNIIVSGNFAYVSSRDNRQELQIINITDPRSPRLVGTYDAKGNADAEGVFVDDTKVFLVRMSSGEHEFFIVDATIPSAPVLVGSYDLGAQGNEIVVSGNMAYIASDQDTKEVQVLDITRPSAPVLIGSLDLAGKTAALTVALTNTTLVVGQGNILYTVDVATPARPTILGSVNLSGVVNDIALAFGNLETYAFVATGNDAKELQIVDIVTPSTPVVLGSVDVSTSADLLGIAYDATMDRAFGSSASNNEELLIFAPE